MDVFRAFVRSQLFRRLAIAAGGFLFALGLVLAIGSPLFNYSSFSLGSLVFLLTTLIVSILVGTVFWLSFAALMSSDYLEGCSCKESVHFLLTLRVEGVGLGDCLVAACGFSVGLCLISGPGFAA